MTHRKHKWFDLQQKFYGEFGRYRCFVVRPNKIKAAIKNPLWYEDQVYELEEIRQMYQLNDVQYPAPETEPLERGQVYFVTDPEREGKHYKSIWSGHAVDLRRLSLGIIHLKQESAIQHATAMLAGKPVENGE